MPERIEIRILRIAHHGQVEEAEGAPRARRKRSPEQAQERALLLSQMAQSRRPPLAQLVREYGDAVPGTDDSGLAKIRPGAPGNWDPQILEAALRLSTGQVSAPLAMADGYLVIERLPDPPAGPERIGARHILIAHAGSSQKVIDTDRTETEARKLAEEIARKAREPDADWDALAAEFTDEPGSDTTGGDLGVFGRGRMVPSFERVAFALEVGEISEVVQSPFGFHVIQRYK